MRFFTKRHLWILCLVVIPGMGIFAVTDAAQAAASGIDENTMIESGDTKLFVEMRGPRKDAPVVLYLHGGPANPMGILAFKTYVGVELEKHLVLAYLHQRGVLKSPDVPDSTQTITNHLRDVDNVVDFLRQRFDRDRISLIGHSWGGTLAYLYLLEHEEKIEKVVSIAAPTNMAANTLASYEMTLQWARDGNYEGAVSDLQKLGSPPYENYQQYLVKSLWAADAFGSLTKNISWDKLIEGSGYTKYEDAWGEEQMRISEAMYPELRTINVEDDISGLRTPLLIISGRNDAEVPYFSLKKGLESYGGEKKFVAFGNSHHLPFVDEPERFVKEVEAFFLE